MKITCAVESKALGILFVTIIFRSVLPSVTLFPTSPPSREGLPPTSRFVLSLRSSLKVDLTIEKEEIRLFFSGRRCQKNKGHHSPRPSRLCWSSRWLTLSQFLHGRGSRSTDISCYSIYSILNLNLHNIIIGFPRVNVSRFRFVRVDLCL